MVEKVMRKIQLATNWSGDCYERSSHITITFRNPFRSESLIMKSIASPALLLLNLTLPFSLRNAILTSKRQRRAQTARPPIEETVSHCERAETDDRLLVVSARILASACTTAASQSVKYK
jgi:hypothetical protein